MKEQQQREQAKEKRLEKELQEAKNLAASLEGASITLKAKSGEGGKLFGSITSKDIAEGIKREKKVTVDRRKIELKEPIKDLGTTKVRIKLYNDVYAEVNVNVSEG